MLKALHVHTTEWDGVTEKLYTSVSQMVFRATPGFREMKMRVPQENPIKI
jgi:hypothetical protein